MEYVNNFEKSKNFKKNVFSKKTKIVFSSIIILLNCFLLKSNIKQCNAKNPNEHIFFKTSSEHRTLGINTVKLEERPRPKTSVRRSLRREEKFVEVT